MNSFSCPLPNSAIKELTDKIISKYPDASKRSNFTVDQCCEWIGAYNNANNKNLDFIPDMNSLVSFVEKKRNTDGKSFLSVPYSITYNLPGQKTQTYTIIGSKIFNKDGKEVFTADLEQNKTHRNKIFANLAVQQKRAVVVEHNNNKYVVNNKNQIISVATGKMMQWGEENGDRKAILEDAKNKFENLSNKNQNISTSNQEITSQLIDHLKSMGINVLGRAEMEEFLKKNNIGNLQQSIDNISEEMESIKKEAIANDTFMKAPNGKSTNLNEKQWLQVRTKAFKDWFGNWEKDPANASKVVDENGEPLIVYHGTLGEFDTFDFEKLGNVTGTGYYIDKITGEKVEIDSSSAFFFTNNYNAAKSYRNLSVWKDNKKKAVFYRNLYAVFKQNHHDWIKLDSDLKEEQKNFIDNVLSPIIGFNVRKAANDITNGTSTLTEEEIDKYANAFRNMAIKLDQLTDARSISNMSNNLEHNKQNLKLLIDNKKSIISGEPIKYFEDRDMCIVSGYGNRHNKDVYLIISLEEDGYYVAGIPNTNGQIKITDSNYEKIVKEFNRGIINNENALIEEETKGKYNSKGHIMEVFLNIKNPSEHNYEYSAFPDKYKETNYETSYIAARQVKKAIQNNNDGVIYKNVRDPFIMNSYGIFNPNQVKSATNNIGTFSTIDNNIEKFTTPQGEVYGFVDKKNNIYLDETIISPEHPIHEYTHLWDRTIAKNNPRLWNRGVTLMKQLSLWNEIANDANYGKVWESKGISGERLTNLIASEVHSRLAGKEGKKILDTIAKQKGMKRIVESLKQWINNMWSELKSTFGTWTNQDLDNMSIDDFINMPIRDFAEGINPNNINQLSSNDNIENFNNEKISEEIISSDKTILSNEELRYWNANGVDNMPRILVGSERTDPAFHVKEILDVINGNKSIDEWGIVNGKRQVINHVSGKDFAGLYLITKHDGLPMLDLLETKIPKLIHFSITGLGGSKYEPGVMKYNDLLDKINDYIKQGLDPESVTIRIDPIVPGVTSKESIEEIVKRASEMGIKRIRFSIMDAYTNTRKAMSSLGYDFNKYYGDGFFAKEEYISSISDFMLSLKDKYDITLGTCAENIAKKGISKEGCLSVGAVNSMLGTSIQDKGTGNNDQRKLCSCYGGKIDALQYNSKCASHCIYCYAKHENDTALRYYNEDGTLKNNIYTQSRRVSLSPSPATSDINTNNLAESSVSFELTDAEIKQAQTQISKKAEEEKVTNLPKPKSEAYESAFKQDDSRIAQFHRTFSPQQLKDRGAMISDIFSQLIDIALGDAITAQEEIINNDDSTDEQKNEAKKRLNELRDPVNGRQLITKNQIPEFITAIKKRLEYNLSIAEEDKKVLWENTIEFFEELFNTQASLDIEEREGIRIVDLKVQEATSVEDSNNESNSDDVEEKTTASATDGWGFKIRYTNPQDALSKRVRSMLYDIEKSESEKDDLGHIRKYPMGQIYASLISFLSKAVNSADDFVIIDKSYTGQDIYGLDITEEVYPNGYPTFPALEKMKNMYPWAEQLIARLTDDYISPELNDNLRYPSTGGSMTSQLYTNIRTFIPYAKIQIGENKFGVTPLNYQMEDRVQYDKFVANYDNRNILSKHSIYNSDGTINKENAEYLNSKISELLGNNSERVKNAYEYIKLVEQSSDDYKGYDESDTKEFNNWINEVIDVFKSFGIEATEESVLIYLNIKDNGNELSNMFGSMLYASETAKNILDENIPEFNYILDLKDPYGSSLWSHFFDNRGFITDTNYIQSYYDTATKKSKYSYSADNYLMRTFRGVCMGTQAERQAFIEKQFGNKEWFRNQDTKEWRNKWLEYWYNKEDDQTTIPYTNIDNITEYIRNDFGDVTDTKTRSYTDWTPTDIFDVQLRSYGDKKDYAYYLAPIFSDSPMSMTVMGPKLDIDKLLYGYTDDNKIHHQGALVSLVNQELWRINYVRERKKSIEKGIVNPISNFDDGRGAKFCFIPELNSYVFSDTGRSFIEEMEALSKDINNTSKEIEARQIEAITDIVSAKLSDYNAYSFRESGNPEKSVELEQYLNMVYANASIIQLTTIDLAFYKNDTDFQKRFKEVYAGGIKLNTNSKYGKKTENVITICDDVIVSRNYDTIAKEIDSHDALTKEQKERIKGVFKEVNVADAQAIRSMYSFRSVLDMMGNWTDAQENALKHFEEGTWSAEDFDIMYQVIKPFMYTVVDVNDGNGSVIAVPLQHKNSEICALMMYDLISNSLGNSEVYKAFSEFMNTTKDSKGNHLIDMIQFESAGKVGNQGVIDVSFSPVKVIDILNGDSGLEEKLENKECLDNLHPAYDEKSNATLFNDEENARENLYGEDGIKNQLIKLLDAKKISQKDFNTIMSYFRPNKDEIISMLKKATLNDKGNDINPEVVSTVPFENYYQAQPTPAHHIDSEAPFGSQGRNIAIADLPEDIEIEVPCYEQGNKDASHTLKGSDSIIDFVFELLNENLIEDFFGKGSNKGLKCIFKSKESLRDAVKDIVRGNPKYGRDFVEALQLDSENNFRLSINSPTMFHLMEDIITSFFKNHITKQKINGAALIQAAGIGLDDELQLKYDDNGKLLGAECYMPITSKKFFEPFLDDTVINGKKVKVLNIENLKKAGLDKAVGYRIPTENTSSMMPLIIKGFTPLQNGSVIVLPAEITALAGSDFDVDKLFLMLLEYGVRNYNIKKALRDFNHSQNYWSFAIDLMFNKDNINEDDYEDSITDEKFDKEAFKEWFDKNKENYRLSTPEFYQIKYNFNISPKENGRKARNNMIIQMYHKLLSSKKNYASIFNPQGFDDVKRAAKITRIITDTNLITTLFNNYNSSNLVIPSPDSMREFILESARNKGISGSEYTKYEKTINECSDEELRDAYIKKMFVDNSGEAIKWLLDSNTKTKEFIDFINSNSFNESPIFPQTFQHSHAKNMAGSNQLGIYAVQGSMCAKFQRAKVELKPEHSYTINGREITNIDFSDDGKRLKNVGQLIGASADNGKDPNLSDMGSTKKTAPIIGMLLRSGLSHLEAALIANQPIMNEVHYNPDSLSWNRYLDKNKKKRLFKTFVPVTTELLIKGIIDPYSLTYEEETSINCICYKALLQNKAQESLTRISRADSPNGAIGNSYAKARIQKYNVDYFQELQRQDDNFPYKFIDDALSNDAVDVSASEESVREQLKKKKMGLLHGMYALGINSFNSLMSDYFFGATEHFDNTFVKPILYNISTAISDETKEEAINSLYTSYITYVLSGCPLFGNETKSDGTIVTMKEKRDYYLNTFPNEFRKILSENKDIRDLLGNILTVSGNGKNSRIVLKDVGSISKELKKEVQLRFEKLGYLDNNVARDLIKDLFIYSYYDNGLQFTHDSFSSLFTSSFLLNVPVFNETLQKLDNPLSEEEETNFLNQFVLTCNKFIIPLKDNVFPKEAVSDDGEVITIDFNDKDRKFIYRNEFINHTFDSNKPIPFIRYNDSIYVLNTNVFKANGGVAEYNRLSNYPTSSNRPLFSIQMSVNQMANTFNVAEESDKNNIKEEKPSSSQQAETPYEVPKTPNEASRDMSDYVAREASKMEDYDVPNFFIDSTEKNYTSEGENELQKPICNE